MSVITETRLDNLEFLTMQIADISTASSAYLVAPCKGQISEIRTVLHGTIATADADLTFEIGGTTIKDATTPASAATITVTASGSAAGDVDSVTVALDEDAVFEKGDVLEFITDGASTNTIPVTATVFFKQVN